MAGCPRVNRAKKFMCSPRNTGKINFSLWLTGGLSQGCPDFQKAYVFKVYVPFSCLRKTSTIHIELLFQNAPAKSSWADLSWSAANGGLRDGGLSKSEDIWGKRPFSSVFWISQVLFTPSGKGWKRQKKGEKGRFPPISRKGGQRHLLSPHLLHPHLRQPNFLWLDLLGPLLTNLRRFTQRLGPNDVPDVVGTRPQVVPGTFPRHIDHPSPSPLSPQAYYRPEKKTNSRRIISCDQLPDNYQKPPNVGAGACGIWGHREEAQRPLHETMRLAEARLERHAPGGSMPSEAPKHKHFTEQKKTHSKCTFLQKHAFSCRKCTLLHTMQFSRGKLQGTTGNSKMASGLRNQEC